MSDQIDMIDMMDENELRNELRNALKKLYSAEIALTPRRWPAEVSDKWHRNIPDMVLAFSDLKKWAGL